jgi:hypothetical protein
VPPVYQRPHQRSPRALPKDYRFNRRPLWFATQPLCEELDGPELEWIESEWKWHVGTRFCLLRGGAQQGYNGSELTSGSSVDHPNLEKLPRLRAVLNEAFPAPAAVAWLGWLPRGSRIFLHVDNTGHWDEHHRVHVPLITNLEARLCVAGRFLHLDPASAWLVNNSVVHGALNRGPDRLHLMLDLPASEAVDRWVAGGIAEVGEEDGPALDELAANPLAALPPEVLQDRARLARMLQQ